MFCNLYGFRFCCDLWLVCEGSWQFSWLFLDIIQKSCFFAHVNWLWTFVLIFGFAQQFLLFQFHWVIIFFFDVVSLNPANRCWIFDRVKFRYGGHYKVYNFITCYIRIFKSIICYHCKLLLVPLFLMLLFFYKLLKSGPLFSCPLWFYLMRLSIYIYDAIL